MGRRTFWPLIRSQVYLSLIRPCYWYIRTTKMSITRDTVLQVIAVLFPPACLACGRIEGIESLPMCLCSQCHLELHILDKSDSQSGRAPESALDGLHSRWSYKPPFEAVIHGLKFGKLEFLGQDLADGLHQLVLDEAPETEIVVPIPLYWHRRMTRGYNQARAIAAPLARRLGIPMIHALRRRRPTRPQARLKRGEREINLRLAFAPVRHRSAKIAGRRLLLVDDVVTTGATLEAAASCLRNHGAHSVWAVTAGRTPGPNGYPHGERCHGEDQRPLTRFF